MQLFSYNIWAMSTYVNSFSPSSVLKAMKSSDFYFFERWLPITHLLIEESVFGREKLIFDGSDFVRYCSLVNLTKSSQL
jgi:hypothetical protein